MMSFPVWLLRGLCQGGFCAGGLCPGMSLSRGLCQGDPPYGKERAVRIILECILIFICAYFK